MAGKNKRISVQTNIVVQVLTESGYRCAVPTCRQILAIDLHHMVEVSKGGQNDPGNLLPLCPTCHALFHRGTIKQESIYVWKSILVSLTQAFDLRTVDQLLFLKSLKSGSLYISGDGVLEFNRLIASGLAVFELAKENGPLLLYVVRLTARGAGLISAWLSGNRKSVAMALSKKNADL
jgi:hypothetical protein